MFFRFLVTTEDLFPVLQPTKLTKLHVLCQTNNRHPAGCLPRLNYKIPPRGRKIILRILPKSTIPLPLSLNSSQETNKNLTNQTRNGENNQMVSRRLTFPSPLHESRKYFKCNSDFDVSGIILIDEEDEDIADPVLAEDTETTCWFQVQSSLIGFHFAS